MDKVLEKLAERIPEMDGGFRRRMAAGMIVIIAIFSLKYEKTFLIENLFVFPSFISNMKTVFDTPVFLIVTYVMLFALGRFVEIYSPAFIDQMAKLLLFATGPIVSKDNFKNPLRWTLHKINNSLRWSFQLLVRFFGLTAKNCVHNSHAEREIVAIYKAAEDANFIWQRTSGINSRRESMLIIKYYATTFSSFRFQNAWQNLLNNIEHETDKNLIRRKWRELMEVSVISSAICFAVMLGAFRIAGSIYTSSSKIKLSTYGIPPQFDSFLSLLLPVVAEGLLLGAVWAICCLILRGCYRHREKIVLQVVSLAMTNLNPHKPSTHKTESRFAVKKPVPRTAKKPAKKASG